MNIALRAFAEGKAEMGFWPVASMVYVYTLSQGPFQFFLIGAFAFSGAITYLLLDRVREALKTAQRFRKKKNQVGRAGAMGNSDASIADMTDAVLDYFPDNRKAWWTVFLGLIFNVFGGFALFILLLHQIYTGNSDIPVVGLTSLPLLYISVLAMVYVWNLPN